MSFFRTALDYLKNDIESIGKDKKKIDEKVILQINKYYQQQEKNNLEAKLIILKSRIMQQTSHNIVSVIAVIVSILSILITISNLADNVLNTDMYTIINETRQKSDEYDNKINDNKMVVAKYDKEINESNKAYQNDDKELSEKIDKELNSHSDYVQANQMILLLEKEKHEMYEQSEERLKQLPSKWIALYVGKIILIIILTIFIIIAVIMLILNKNRKCKNISDNIQIDVIKQIIEEKDKNDKTKKDLIEIKNTLEGAKRETETLTRVFDTK